MTHGSIFTGIGGFDLGFEWAGIKTIWQVEIDEYCRRLLELRFPDARRYADIRQFVLADSQFVRWPDERTAKGCGEGQASAQLTSCYESPDIISGGFPCQPVSHAGKRQGANDDRYLWPEMFRVVRALRPRWVVAENVYGLITHEGGELLDAVYNDLESEGYETLPPIVLPACAFGAPHRRDRVWIVAHRQQPGLEGQPGDELRGDKPGRIKAPERRSSGEADLQRRGDWWATEPAVGRVANGIPRRVDRLRGLGNAIVPQIAYLIGGLIIEADAS